MQSCKPVKRSLFRIYLGKKYYRLQRYFDWYFGRKKYATKKQNNLLPYVIFKHKTPLMRQLKDLDMWLQFNKIKNLKIAANQLNRILIKPGEVLSYWRLIGNTTKSKGYIDGMILFYGKVTSGTGGGLCQLSNLIYWMTLHSPLSVTERHRHSYDVFPDCQRNQPFGSGATCAYNYLDLQIKNETTHNFQLIIYLTDNHLVGEWRADIPSTRKYEVYEKEHWITQEYWGGYIRHNKIFRKSFNLQHEIVEDKFITENHAIMMYPPLLETAEK